MGCTSSKINSNEIKIGELAEDFFNNYLEKKDLPYSHVPKLIKVTDFVDLCTFTHTFFNIDVRSKLIEFYEFRSYGMININSDCDIGIKTRYIIYMIRELMLDRRQLILTSVNIIDSFNENYNENENNKKITELNELLIIENFKMNNIKFDHISSICENISNLEGKLLQFQHYKFQFEEGIKNKEILKIELINISLFLISTNHLFKDENSIIEIPHATMLPNPSAPYEYINIEKNH